MGCSSSSDASTPEGPRGGRQVTRYTPCNGAVVLCCYFNPKKSPYRLRLFRKFYESIQHLEHRIIECAIGNDDFELTEVVPAARFVRTKSLLFHKEGLLNILIRELPPHLKYVFWLDTDLVFTNANWLPESVEKLECGFSILQPFEYAIHMEKDMSTPSKEILGQKPKCMFLMKPPSSRRVWRSFGANVEQQTAQAVDRDYDKHGHVGFAWGARREVLDGVGGLYDRALIGGGDHVIAHAAVSGSTLHGCILDSHIDPFDRSIIAEWSGRFFSYTQGKVGFIGGDVNHMWHGDLTTRDYFNRIRKFSRFVKILTKKDNNGLFVEDRDGGGRDGDAAGGDAGGEGGDSNNTAALSNEPVMTAEILSSLFDDLSRVMDDYFGSREVDRDGNHQHLSVTGGDAIDGGGSDHHHHHHEGGNDGAGGGEGAGGSGFYNWLSTRH